MNIFIDESGSFVDAPNVGAHNAIAAYLSPECDRLRARRILGQLKRKAGASLTEEIKLKDIGESDYFRFLMALNKLDGVLYAVATDAGANQMPDILSHQADGVSKIVANTGKLKHEALRNSVLQLGDRLGSLPPQLYVQLFCQLVLLDTIIRFGVLYFVQRCPKSLARFRWRIDQKNSEKTVYEKAFQQILPPYLQSSSVHDPLIALIGEDYSSFSRFDWTPENEPKYLQDQYGIEVEGDVSTNIGMLINEDLQFVDSKNNLGVQIADLLASGLRRCLRGEFNDNEAAAAHLGKLMVQQSKGNAPLTVVAFAEKTVQVNDTAARSIRIVGRHMRPMLAKN